MRRSEKELKRLSNVFKKCTCISTSVDGNIGRVLVNHLGIDTNKFYATGWGSETIDYINHHKTEISTEDAKKALGLSGHYLITCGYNGFDSQRHELMLRAIAGIRHQLPEKLTLILPVTYGSSNLIEKNEYICRLKEITRELALDAVFYENYLSVPELFILRQATDMFIHIQTTDAGNCSMQEYVLCGKKVINGTWFQYTHLEKYKPLFYFPVDNLDRLDQVILNAFHSDKIETPKEVIEYIYNRGWKAKMKIWNEMFISLIK